MSGRGKKRARQIRRQKHAPPPRGRVDEKAQLAGLNKIIRDDYGKDPNAPLGLSSSPGTWSTAKRGLCTPQLAKMMAVYVMTICFTYQMVETSLYCGWWWWLVGALLADT